MVILAIDTSSAATTVAVVDDDTVLAMAEHVDARRHAEVLAPMIAGLGGHDVATIAVGVGPGPYTGLRVGITTAQALALAWGVPIVGVCSLDVLAAEAVERGVAGPFVAAGDARRREVYWARYDTAGRRVAGPFVGPPAAGSAPSALPPDARSLPWLGEGALLHADAVGPIADPAIRFPRADVLARFAAHRLAEGEQAAGRIEALSAHGSDDGSTARAIGVRRLLAPSPLYVRRPDAAEPPGVAS